jgi:hypothetical protein
LIASIISGVADIRREIAKTDQSATPDLQDQVDQLAVLVGLLAVEVQALARPGQLMSQDEVESLSATLGKGGAS